MTTKKIADSFKKRRKDPEWLQKAGKWLREAVSGDDDDEEDKKKKAKKAALESLGKRFSDQLKKRKSIK